MDGVPIASIAALRQALRARIAELDVTLDSVDAIAGAPERYFSKVLAPNPCRPLTWEMFFLLAESLGLDVVLRPNAGKLAALQQRQAWATHSLNGPQYRMRESAA